MCGESFVPKGPGVVVVGRIMSCPGVELAGYGSALVLLTGIVAWPSGLAGALHTSGAGVADG